MLIESLPTHDNALHDIRLRFSAEGLHVSGILYVVIYILAGIAGALFRGVVVNSEIIKNEDTLQRYRGIRRRYLTLFFAIV